MGTSQSSKGSPSNVPFIPPWVTDGDDGLAEPVDPATTQQVPLAPLARFAGTRRALGRFAASGDESALRSGVARYVRDGLGGGSTAAGRFGRSASTAGRLYDVLTGLGGVAAMPRDAGLDRAALSDQNAQAVLAAVAEAVRPVDGTQDGEAARDAVGRALSEVLRQDPEANLLQLTEAQRLLAVELYLVEDVFNRVNLDVGGTIRARAPSPAAFVSRLASLRSYITQVIRAAFRGLSAQGRRLGRSDLASLSRRAVRDAVTVFEGGGE